MKRVIYVGTCDDCPHLDFTGRIMQGKAQPCCDHDSTFESRGEGSSNRRILRFPKIPAWCPLDKATENTALKKFAREFIKTECWNYKAEIDGGTVQEVAEQCGLIKSQPATKEQAEQCGYCEIGDPWFTFTDILKEK